MKKAQWLLVIPFIGMAFCLPWVNRIEPYVLGLPFILFWIVLWMVLSSAILYIVYRIEYGKEEKQ
ncbi:uncharacterized protein DUF3311 [Cytobacillus horneckiae]|uniref:DUF3311 domain-containing protein n=1 Tax=Cytobacillus horneckiae TaxID=549687 RepID=A0A2N0ZIK5_9BACI|nr:DUF3311 domain-containing protein [Cytobacillus horneckiae]NRG43210.1 DUF3311 domain-containing protein [Bacillus sp. CRN 9]MBN6886708.1 DUF3311 domain-containing protein [Cytobacillus horneckiae]MCM3177820.1 DUF3311 domain-containing protein [Cytobacillus horneckiae]MEC1157374.1 DUF3311 domain-containing protein [Cytobacillus horneckiae]MED2935745.1 DUF3311 domain-containing protein [Cytobacillus horneckiae]